MRAALLALLPVACTACTLFDAPDSPERPDQLVQAALYAFRTGDIRLANEILNHTRDAHPEHGATELWSAVVAEMQWNDTAALRALRSVSRSKDRAGLEEAEISGRVGDLLFRTGRYGESLPYLEAGNVGPERARRLAMAKLAARLPYTRREVASGPIEVPMLQQPRPEIVCFLGQKQRSFLVDTGSSSTSVARDWAGELGIREQWPAGLATDGMGRTFPVSMGILESFELAGVELGPLPVMVVDEGRLALQDPFGGPLRATSGVLGLDVLSRFRTTLEPKRGVLLLEPPGQDVEERFELCLRSSGNLLVPVHIEGVALWFVLDTGASHSSITQQGLRALPGGEHRAVETFRHIRSPGGSGFAVRQVADLTLHVSQARFAGVDLPVVQRQQPMGFPIHGVIGADLLMRCRIVLEPGRMRMEAL